MKPATSSRHARRRTLLGSAASAITLILAIGSAHAQTSVQANGLRVDANEQIVTAGVIRADAIDAHVVSIAGPMQGSTIEVSGNDVVATARANRTGQTIDGNAEPGTGGYAATQLTGNGLGIAGTAGALIANRQTSGSVAINADIFDTRIGITGAFAAGASLSVAGNSQDADARGNDATATLERSFLKTTDGAGIVSSQSMGSASGVAARSRLGATLDTGAAYDSQLAVTGNLDSASAASNRSDNLLSAKGVTLVAPTLQATGSRVPQTWNGDPRVEAGYAILTDQSALGIVRAVTGEIDGSPTFATTAHGNVAGTSLATDGNLLTASTTGNRTANAISLDAAGIAPESSGGSETPSADGAIAHVTSVQRTNAALVQASTYGGAETRVSGALTSSEATATGNRAQSIATANQIDSNRIDIASASLGTSADQGRAGWDADSGDAFVTAEIGVHTVQDFGESLVAAGRFGVTSAITTNGLVGSSTLNADGNSALAAGSGNRAANAIAIDSGNFRSSAAIGNIHQGSGDIAVSIGTLADAAGVRIIPVATVSDSSLSVTGNTATGNALGNAAANTLTIVANQLAARPLSGMGLAGSQNDYRGAAGTLALSNSQSLGGVGALGVPSAVSVEIFSRSGIDSGVLIQGSTITVDGNTDAATAIGNTAYNRIGATAAMLDPDATTALASRQFGNAEVDASLSTWFDTSGALDKSSASIANNKAQALGVINDADNAITLDAGSASGITGNSAVVASLASEPFALGNHVLSSEQNATGRVGSTARSGFGTLVDTGALSDTTYTVSDNRTFAEASANRASNTVEANTATAAQSGIGLANGQASSADVAATADNVTRYSRSGPGFAVSGSTLLLNGNSSASLARGNAADNSLVVKQGTGITSAASPSVSIGTASFTGVVAADAALLNAQDNRGAVGAFTSGLGVMPLNASTGGALNATITASGNSLAASAYGNSTVNSIAVSGLGPLPVAAIGNSQYNSGNVTAQVISTGIGTSGFAVTGSQFSLTGNSLAATAMGNQASSAIASPR